MRKQITILLIVVGMLIGAGGCIPLIPALIFGGGGLLITIPEIHTDAERGCQDQEQSNAIKEKQK